MSEIDLTEITVESCRAYDGHFLKINRDRVRLPDGKESQREYVVHPGAVAIIPLITGADGVLQIGRAHV